MTPQDPTTDYSARMLRLFGRYADWYFRRHFNALRIARTGQPKEYPAGTILYANHPSWWDPIILLLCSAQCFADKRVFAPIDAVALERYSILKRLGLFSIEPGSAAAAREFLRKCDHILRAEDSMLAITAQGRFADSRERPLELRRGLAHLLRGRSERQAVPVALEYAFWNERMPEVLVHFGEPISAKEHEPITALQHRLEHGLQNSIDHLSANAMRRDEDAFEALILGSKQGVGGIYGQFEKWRARLSGRPYSSAHGRLDS